MKKLAEYSDEEIDALPAGVELDALAAAAMGWGRIVIGNRIAAGSRRGMSTTQSVPAYSTDPAAMLEAMEWLAQKCSRPHPSLYAYRCDEWTCDGRIRSAAVSDDVFNARAETAPLAVARAIAKAGKRINQEKP